MTAQTGYSLFSAGLHVDRWSGCRREQDTSARSRRQGNQLGLLEHPRNDGSGLSNAPCDESHRVQNTISTCLERGRGCAYSGARARVLLSTASPTRSYGCRHAAHEEPAGSQAARGCRPRAGRKTVGQGFPGVWRSRRRAGRLRTGCRPCGLADSSAVIMRSAEIALSMRRPSPSRATRGVEASGP